MEIRKIPLTNNQYYQKIYEKKFICLHHTAGGSAASAIAHWQANKERVATPFVIERTGDIYQCYDPKYWAYALGVKGATELEKATIHIELVSYGGLTQKDNGQFYTYTQRKIPLEEVYNFDQPWRGFKHFHAYTQDQVASLNWLILDLVKRFNIRCYQPKDWYMLRDWKTLPFGIYSHTTVNAGKSDIYPDARIRSLIPYFRG